MNTNHHHFFSVAGSKLKFVRQMQRHYDLQLAPRFNALDFWAVDENKVSQILAYFLNPAGGHGQGDRFLKTFCNILIDGNPFADTSAVVVNRERPTENGRRIDITISTPNDAFVLGIENKIYEHTADGNNQVSDYLVYLDKITQGNYRLIYLAPRKKLLAAHSISIADQKQYQASGHLLLRNYEEHLIPCIEEFERVCEAANVSAFLKDFKKRLNKMYMGETTGAESSMLIEHALETTGNLEISLKLAASLHVIKKRLCKDMEDELSALGQSLGMDVTQNGMALRPKGWKMHKIRFKFEQNGLIYGIVRDVADPNKSTITTMTTVLGGNWNASEHWPLWRFMYTNTEQNQQFWIDIKSGAFKTQAQNFIGLVQERFGAQDY